MIFINSKDNKPDVMLRMGKYHSWRNGTNDQFDDYSSLILAVKRMRIYAIDHFFAKIDNRLSPKVVIAAVPSHDPANTNSGIIQLAKKLAANGRIDGTGTLVRHTKIKKLTQGGDRSVEVHLKSIKVMQKKLITGAEVLLLDDVMTTENSLIACKQLLLEAGAKTVQCLALGKTSS